MPGNIVPVTLIKGDRIGVNTDYRDALPENMYAVARPILGADGYMLCYPGIRLYQTGAGVDRAGIYNERFGKQYRVSGDKLVSISDSGVTELGTVSGSDQASMPYSFNTQAVIANGNMFLYDPTNGFQQITDPDLGTPIDGTWINGYYFLTDGEFLYHTEVNDETQIDPIKFATAEFSPDPTLGVSKTQDNKAIAWGRYSIEYFVNTPSDNGAAAGFAFRRIETRAQKIGIVATHAKCESQGNWYICGGRKDDGIGIYLIGIGQSVKVSTREVDKILDGYAEPELSQMRMESRLEDDVLFVMVHLPRETLCFNATIAATLGKEVAWFKMKTDVLGNAPYRAINGVFDARAGGWIYGDKLDTNVGILDNSLFTHYDETVEWVMYSPFIDLETFSVDEISLETIPGFTTEKNPTVALSLTYDGISYSQERWMEYGGAADYHKRFFARRLGYVQDWFGYKFRGPTRSRMAFGLFKMEYS